MDAQLIATLAERFLHAEETRTPIEVPTIDYPDMTVTDAYAVQRRIVAQKVARGDRVIGKKVGLTSRANQDVFGVHEPVYGQLLASGLHMENIPVETARLIRAISVCDIRFGLGQRLVGAGITVSVVLRA